MTTRCDTCEYHEDRGLQLADHGAKLSAHEVEIENMKEAQIVLFKKFDAAAEKNAIALKELCAEIKQVKMKLTGPYVVPADRPGAMAAAAEVEKAFENQPVGYLNTMLKKVFTSPVFWAIMGWVVLKIFLFGEYPAFSSKARPYMAAAAKAQKDAGGIEYHFKDQSGNAVVLIPVQSDKAEEEKK
jgi:hypothetical protein